MMSIDQTIVSIAAPTIQRDLALSSTGLQWVINGYLLALAALFVLGGKVSDVLGHRRMIVVTVFNAFAARERGKALALFFGISGALTSIGPIAGSFLLPWTWRAISSSTCPSRSWRCG